MPSKIRNPAAVLALHLVARGRLLPGVSRSGFDAWRIGPLDPDDVRQLRALTAAMPPQARAVPLPGTLDDPLLPDADRRPQRLGGGLSQRGRRRLHRP